jgi:hypothetical protein
MQTSSVSLSHLAAASCICTQKDTKTLNAYKKEQHHSKIGLRLLLTALCHRLNACRVPITHNLTFVTDETNWISNNATSSFVKRIGNAKLTLR